MSAQVIAALRRRAAMLEDEAHELLLRQADSPQVLRSKVRSPEHLLVIAAEFAWLADEAEGRTPQTPTEQEQP